MNQELLISSNWYRATTLTERTALSRTESGQGNLSQIDLDRATRRLQHWRSDPSFDTNTLFADRLAADGVTENQFLHLLGEPVEVLRGRFPAPPAWLTQLTQAFSRPMAADSAPRLEASPQTELVAFVDVVRPLIEQARVEVRDGVNRIQRAHSHLPFEPDTVEKALFAGVPRRLAAMLSRTIALELNVARLQGVLQGERPKERFQSFVQRLSQRD